MWLLLGNDCICMMLRERHTKHAIRFLCYHANTLAVLTNGITTLILSIFLQIQAD